MSEIQGQGVDLHRLGRFAERIPLNAHLGLTVSLTDDDEVEVRLPWSDAVANTYGSVHAIAVLAPAELASGLALLGVVGAVDLAPVALALQARYRRPGRGDLTARPRLDESLGARVRQQLGSNGQADVEVPVDVVDSAGTVVAEVTVAWALRPRPKEGGSNG